MKNNYLGLKGFIEQTYPEFTGRITGSTYPPSAFAQTVASLSSYCWFGGVGLMLSGNSVFEALGMPMPALVVQMNANKPASFFGLFLINSLGGSLLSTGAFEIYINDDLVFSKLEQRRFPTAEDVTMVIGAMGYKAG
mmetsp:Transcript_21138/g.47818  ORF Transcript_21138/g.47818 Transcript_21138/m.47818 type:complete len:137 (-) Transcript_21138:155-565(-)|eukprot:CAMPEP_0173178182 /NCGR_PEP_ID=MMETSP1141-20130122/5392_1 /TAXON_ID=483371 /ORGANISM="non described non described, Strain CCMP2298" /LENGTH=136 /DNA_ID=CAMNT_0014100641 /DNA_START=209 /DNA_END=619 /DNA_ORIENTATION=+